MSVIPTVKSTTTEQEENSDLASPGTSPILTVFTIPKSFTQPDVSRIQTNAIRSWLHLDERVDVLLLGNEPGIKECARELGVQHEAELERNHQGTPLVSDAFRIANRVSRTKLLMYCNADVILTGQVVWALRRILDSPARGNFLAMGRRIDVELNHSIDWESDTDRQAILADLTNTGQRAPIVCKEYFAFPAGLYQELPRFAVGRGNWDNWLVSSSRKARIPVINVSNYVMALHQNHGYSHLDGTRWQCYVSGEEACENERLAGGKRLISGAVADWILNEGNLSRNPLAWINGDFWWDLPRFLGMVASLPFQR